MRIRAAAHDLQKESGPLSGRSKDLAESSTLFRGWSGAASAAFLVFLSALVVAFLTALVAFLAGVGCRGASTCGRACRAAACLGERQGRSQEQCTH